MRFSLTRKRFRDLTEQEVLALAISSEEDDARIYRGYAESLRGAKVSVGEPYFNRMAVPIFLALLLLTSRSMAS